MASPKTPAKSITAASVTRWFRHQQKDASPLWATFARWALRSVLTSPEKAGGLNTPVPKGLATADINALVCAVVKAAIEKKCNPDELDELLKAKFNKLVGDEPIICVDNVLRWTVASDMPINCRVVLRTLAGHAKAVCGDDDYVPHGFTKSDMASACWVSRATLAGECGLSEPTLDRAIADLADHGWIRKTHRFIPTGEGAAQTSSVYRVCAWGGRWWDPSERLKKHRKPPVRENNGPAMPGPGDTDDAVPAAAADVADDFHEASFAEDAAPEKTEAAAPPTPPSSKKPVQGDTAAAIASFNAALAASAPPTVNLPPADPWKPSVQALALAASKGIDVDALVAEFTESQGYRFADPSQRHRLDDAFFGATIAADAALVRSAKRARRVAEASAEASF